MVDPLTHGVLLDLAQPYPLSVRWAELEEQYLQGRYAGSSTIDDLGERSGTGPVLVTAGHSVTHFRLGVRKLADMTTGGLAELLAEQTAAASLTCTGIPSADPNFDDDGPFKRRYHQLLANHSVVLDLHGMRPHAETDICLARGAAPASSRWLFDLAADVLTTAGFHLSVDTPFDATRPASLTSTAQRAGAYALELELAKSVRNPWDDAPTCHRLAEALTTLIGQVELQLPPAPVQ